MVSPDPWNEGEEGTAHVCEEREGRIYHVEFLGKDHTHNWIVEDKVRESELCVSLLLLFIIAKTHHPHILLLLPFSSSSSSTIFFFFFQLEPYYGSEVKPHLGALRSSKSLATALTEADQLTSLTPAVRLEKCVFRKNCTISNHSTDTGGM